MKSNNIYKQFKQFLNTENLSFIEKFGESQSVGLKIRSEFGLIFVTVYHIAEKNTLLCISEFPIRIPNTKRIRISDFISTINSESLISNFVLNPNNFLLVKTSLYACENKIEDETFRRLVYVNINSLIQNFKKIMVLAEINYSSKSVSQNRISLN
jgi:hypothetical protein